MTIIVFSDRFNEYSEYLIVVAVFTLVTQLTVDGN